MNKFLCNCKKLATWYYMPSSEYPRYGYYCDDCVPRGCSCNTIPVPLNDNHGEYPPINQKQWKWIEKDVTWENLDNLGRKYPCCEFDHNIEGYDVTNEEIEFFKEKNVEYFI